MPCLPPCFGWQDLVFVDNVGQCGRHDIRGQESGVGRFTV